MISKRIPLTRGAIKGLRRARRLQSRWIPVISRRTQFKFVCSCKPVCTQVVYVACVRGVGVRVYEQILQLYPDVRH